jgi:hypothetical protein
MICAVLPLGAREVTVTVLDEELGIPLEGAEIRSFDGSAYQGDEEGKVTFEAPGDRPVVIRGVYPGYTPGRLVIEPGKDEYTMELRLAGVLEARELVLEESRAGDAGTTAGRSVALEEAEIRRTGEIGIIEDVMTSVKLLPGVGYSGLFNAMPSIRGGQPGDLMAAMDGFYIGNPYHWGGAFSIFDPKMVQSARLSHGVFSSRYGHTISGLLDIAVKKPSPQGVEFEAGLSTSVANASLSFPINARGGVMFMGKVTYYDPIVWAFQGISRASGLEVLKPVESVSTAPYIRSLALTAGYRFSDSLEAGFTGFFGADGAAADYKNDGGGSLQGAFSEAEISGRWVNYQGFGLASLAFNPRNDMVLKAVLGAGYSRSELDGFFSYSVRDIPYDSALRARYPSLPPGFSFDSKENVFSSGDSANVQGRADLDWDLGRGFLAALGFQELYSRHGTETSLSLRSEVPSAVYFAISGHSSPAEYVNYAVPYRTDADRSHSLTSSGYVLGEYKSPGGRFGAELGLRLDQMYFSGDGFSLAGPPALSPRLNLDFLVLKDRGPFESLSLTAGTGLFSSASDVLSSLQSSDLNGGFTLKPERSFTSLGGIRAEFPQGLSIDVEGYYKRVFDRTYVFTDIIPLRRYFHFDGEGDIWGFDILLKKSAGRYLDGWISYSFNSALYREPGAPVNPNTFINISNTVSGGWYYPSFHRFHVLNMILNFKPSEKFSISTRFGLASGVPLFTVTAGRQPYLVEVLDNSGNRVGTIQKWKQISARDNSNRVSVSIPLDIKFSFVSFKPGARARQEFYVAVENVLSLIHTPKGNTTFNPYTGEENRGSMAASYDIPVPVPSFGFKWSY